jgi:hypothetical protein
MKKFILIVVLIITMTGISGFHGTVSAQELKFDGYINSGLGFVTSDIDGSDPFLKTFGVDSEQNGYRLRLNGSYTNEANNAGIKFRLQSQAGLTNSSREFISLPFAFGWVNFLDNKLSVNAGIIEDNTWTTGDFWLASDSVSDFAGLGALIKITPVDGLIFGLGAHTIGRRGGGDNNTLAKTSFGEKINLEDARITFHAVYTMKDVFRIGASYRTESSVGTAVTSKLYGDFRYLGIKDLTAIFATSVDNLGDDFDKTGTIILSETFAYKMDNINFGLNAVQFLYNDKAKDTGMLFNIWGSYTINNIIPRLDLVYFMGGRSNFIDYADIPNPVFTWHRKGFAATQNKDHSLISIRPSIRLNLDNKTHLEIGDMINIDNNDSDSIINNVFYIDLKWSF